MFLNQTPQNDLANNRFIPIKSEIRRAEHSLRLLSSLTIRDSWVAMKPGSEQLSAVIEMFILFLDFTCIIWIFIIHIYNMMTRCNQGVDLGGS